MGWELDPSGVCRGRGLKVDCEVVGQAGIRGSRGHVELILLFWGLGFRRARVVCIANCVVEVGEIRFQRVVTPRLDANPIPLRHAHFEMNYCSNLLYLYLIVLKYVFGTIFYSTNEVLVELPAMYTFFLVLDVWRFSWNDLQMI